MAQSQVINDSEGVIELYRLLQTCNLPNQNSTNRNFLKINCENCQTITRFRKCGDSTEFNYQDQCICCELTEEQTQYISDVYNLSIIYPEDEKAQFILKFLMHYEKNLMDNLESINNGKYQISRIGTESILIGSPDDNESYVTRYNDLIIFSNETKITGYYYGDIMELNWDIFNNTKKIIVQCDRELIKGFHDHDIGVSLDFNEIKLYLDKHHLGIDIFNGKHIVVKNLQSYKKIIQPEDKIKNNIHSIYNGLKQLREKDKVGRLCMMMGCQLRGVFELRREYESPGEFQLNRIPISRIAINWASALSIAFFFFFFF